ncbi:MAG: SDR family oxidoreductase [bacterium]
MDFGIRDRAALVTGASAGLGFACASALAGEGCRVAVASRDRDRIEAAAAAIREATGGDVHAVVADVSSPGGPAAAVDATVRALGGLEILVTNAGGPPSGTFDSLDESDFERAVTLTFRSVDRLVRAALPHLRAAKWGRIVNLTSITAKEPHDGLLLSNAMRPAVHGLAKTLSRELARDGITVNSVCTGYTATERLQDLAVSAGRRRGVSAESVLDGWRANIPRGQLGRPEEIAAVVAFLCSEAASVVNGVSLAVDGGESHSLL